ncbi:MAG: exodeoxyribonuclease VII large subunit [Methanocorpusculum sp.]|nr:exodeoxyribonuclease VII large subunit [Methanocorpusculum sp.]
MTKKAPTQLTLNFGNESEESKPFSSIEPVKENSTLLDTEEKILSVVELTAKIREVLDCESLTDLKVIGEITGYRPNASGHLYFSLTEKGESDATISCVMWKYAAKYVPFALKDGISVKVTGYIDYYPPSGRTQFVVKKMEPASGATGLYLQKELWKKQLEAEGVIPRPESEKRDFPLFPKTIGVVTSKTGSVLQDIRNVLSRRYPLPVILAPAAVQGIGAETEIVSAIESLQGKVDVIIVARGGGSFEDLFVFNNPEVVRAIRNSDVPIISAIGHETDTTLSDFASDRRVPTPSAAAETVVPDRNQLLSNLEEYRRHIHDRAVLVLSHSKREIAELKIRVEPSRLRRKLDMMHQQTAEFEDRIDSAIKRRLFSEHEAVVSLSETIFKSAKNKIARAVLELKAQKEIITGRDPEKPLERGYALVKKDGHVVKSVKNLLAGDILKLKLADGEVNTKVESIK